MLTSAKKQRDKGADTEEKSVPGSAFYDARLSVDEFISFYCHTHIGLACITFTSYSYDHDEPSACAMLRPTCRFDEIE